MRILLVEDERLLRSLMRRLLDGDGRFRVVGEAANREEALALAGTLEPQVILLDLYLGEQCAADFVPQLRVLAPEANILLVTGSDDVEILRRAVQAGARGVVLKDTGIDNLVKAIEKVCSGEMWLDRMFAARMIESFSRPGDGRSPAPEESPVEALTGREKEVASLVCQGLSNKAIARKLEISEATVRHHLTAVFAKLDIPSRLSLVVNAQRDGLKFS